MKLKHLHIIWRFPIWFIIVPFATVAIAVASEPHRMNNFRGYDAGPIIKEMYKEMWAWMLGLPYTPST